MHQLVLKKIFSDHDTRQTYRENIVCIDRPGECKKKYSSIDDNNISHIL
jgi:hypothetical protein